MEVYADSLTEEALRRDFYYAFTDTRYPGIPELRMHTIALDPFIVGDIPVTPILVWHLKMPVMGFRFGKFTYITDANHIDADSKEKIKGSEILVLNALRKQKHISHQLGLHDIIESELPEGIHLAYDKLVIEV